MTSNDLLQANAVTSVVELAAKYEARLDALEISKNTFDWMMAVVSYGGPLLLAVLAIVAWWLGKNVVEIRDQAQRDATAAFEREFYKNKQEIHALEELKKQYDRAVLDVEKIKETLSGYVQLSQLIGSVENFDPLVQYKALDKEIDRRKENTQAYDEDPKGGVLLVDTIYDPAFRQRASLIFERLLQEVRKDKQQSRVRVDVVTLFNAAANAATIDLDFVALELMEFAHNQDKSRLPEHEARLIRQQLGLSKIDSEEAVARLAGVLLRASGFNLHHVVSEAHNIALHTGMPEKVVALLDSKLSPEIGSTSYVTLVKAGLLYLCGTSEGRTRADQLKLKGEELLKIESKRSRWYKASLREAAKIGIDVRGLLVGLSGGANE